MTVATSADIRGMYQVATAGYRPPTWYKPTFMQMGLPPFTLETVEWMRRDPQVRLGMSIKLAPYYMTKLTIKGDPAISMFMGNMIRRFWMKAVPKITRAFWYTRSGGEITYKLNEGRHEFQNYHDVYPSDISVLCRGSTPVGLTVKPQSAVSDPYVSAGIDSSDTNTANRYNMQPINLFFPKGFLYLHNREFNALRGQSEFEAAYESWMEKCDAQGAKHSRKLWFYKNAFSGGILFHPPGSFPGPDGVEISYQALARQAMETSLNGAVWTFEQTFDPVSGQPLWSYVEPKIQPGGEKILDYVRHLDNEIMRGLGIPDDVVQQISGTGSYAGRSIPLMAFFISQQATLRNLFTICDEQVFRPLCRANFGHDNYEASIEVDVERLMGAMAGDPAQGPSHNEASFQNPQANPQASPGSDSSKVSQFSGGVPLIAVAGNSSNIMRATSQVFNGVWDGMMRVYLNPQDKAHATILMV